MQRHLPPLAGSVLLTASPFLPWLRIGGVSLRGVPDPAGLIVVGVGALGILLSVLCLLRRKPLEPWLMLVGLAGVTTLGVVWMTGPATIADRALARAEAIALVDNVAMQAVPPVRVGIGLLLGLLGAAVVAVHGIGAAWRADSRVPTSNL